MLTSGSLYPLLLATVLTLERCRWLTPEDLAWRRLLDRRALPEVRQHELFEHFNDPARHASIDPRKAIWLTEDNIKALAKDEKFMTYFRSKDR